MSDVYYIPYRSTSAAENTISKINALYTAANLNSVLGPKDLTAVKVHFGEIGNSTFVPPWFLRPIIDQIKSTGASPFLTDAGTIYVGHRKNAIRHLQTATIHGFVPETTGAPVIIADGLKGDSFTEVEINKKRFEKVYIAKDIYDADSMIVVSHFKGHMLSGFGGAIKNLGMGCAPARGKIRQHGIHPSPNLELCTGCGTCVDFCPEGAIDIIDGKSNVNFEKCIGCGQCMSNCPQQAMDLDWRTEIPAFMERLLEYAYGAMINKRNKIGFINFVYNVTADCDCMGYSDTPIVPDVGILASFDPIALDHACLDLVNKQPGNQYFPLKTNFGPGEDKFKGVSAFSQAELEFSYGEEIGLGQSAYNLIEVEIEKSESHWH